MFYVSDIQSAAPRKYENELQKRVYSVLAQLQIPYQRVDTDEAITMEDCVEINRKLKTEMVKTLFLCNRQKDGFYLFITKGDKPFRSKDFSAALNIPRVSFAPADLMETMLGTKIGAVTVFGCLSDTQNKVRIVFDADVLKNEWYGCSDGMTTGYMKVRTDDIVHKLLSFSDHKPFVIEV